MSVKLVSFDNISFAQSKSSVGTKSKALFHIVHFVFIFPSQFLELIVRKFVNFHVKHVHFVETKIYSIPYHKAR